MVNAVSLIRKVSWLFGSWWKISLAWISCHWIFTFISRLGFAIDLMGEFHVIIWNFEEIIGEITKSFGFGKWHERTSICICKLSLLQQKKYLLRKRHTGLSFRNNQSTGSVSCNGHKEFFEVLFIFYYTVVFIYYLHKTNRKGLSTN